MKLIIVNKHLWFDVVAEKVLCRELQLNICDRGTKDKWSSQVKKSVEETLCSKDFIAEKEETTSICG